MLLLLFSQGLRGDGERGLRIVRIPKKKSNLLGRIHGWLVGYWASVRVLWNILKRFMDES